jgi:hypothetical protein
LYYKYILLENHQDIDFFTDEISIHEDLCLSTQSNY